MQIYIFNSLEISIRVVNVLERLKRLQNRLYMTDFSKYLARLEVSRVSWAGGSHGCT